MKVLKITLKQHTPLIHFQHDQYGATLRASEVKPKLDKYIIKNVYHNDFNSCKCFLKSYEKQNEGILLEDFNKQKASLNYKIDITPFNHIESIRLRQTGPDNNNNFSTETFPMLLSNMGGQEDPNKLINFSFYEYIIVTFIFYQNELSSIIENNISTFFANTNFGQRSSKGFGSFTVTKINNKSIKWEENQYYPQDCPLLQFKISKNETLKRQKEIFGTIDFYWKCLKSGINYTRNNRFPYRYIKSYLFNYLNNKEVNKRTWEKQKIKVNFNLSNNNNHSINPNPAIFARGLLGCPEKYLYSNNREIRIVHNEIDLEKIIDRIPSPIYFKPVCFNNEVVIYLLFNNEVINSLKNRQNRKFSFSYNGRSFNLEIEIFLNENNYIEFLNGYHDYLSTNKDVLSALYFEHKKTEYQDCSSDELEADSLAFVPRDFNWKNILTTDQESVTFYNL